MFPTPLICSSSGLATDSETVFALVPGKVATDRHVRGRYRRIQCQRERFSAIPPVSVITIESTEAKIGRSMKNSLRTRPITPRGA